jgi:hypothetical protein
MGERKRYPSIAAELMGFAKSSTHPTDLSKIVAILADLRLGKQLQGAEIPLLWARPDW